MPDSLFKKLFAKKTSDSASSSKDLTRRQVFQVTRGSRFPSWKQWRQLPRILSSRERTALIVSLLVAVLSVVTLCGWYVATHRTISPAVGGEYIEGLIGVPQFVNPLYAPISDVDSDLSRLVFSGLMKWDPQDGLVNDLADAVTVSEDGKTYTVHIRENAKFHNGDPVRANDVLFTIESIQNPAYRSPLSVSFRGVSVSEVDEKTVAFQLTEPFAPFLGTLTVGILPSNVWSDIDPRTATITSRNLEAVGSGPYRFAKFSKDKKGSILSYTLERNGNYYGEKPLIQTLTFKFYADAEEAVQALDSRAVEGLSFIPPDLESEVEKNRSITLLRPLISRETALFFNQEKQPVFKKLEVRQAIAMAIDKDAILAKAVGGHGMVIHSPILPGMLGADPAAGVVLHDIAAANELLTKAGYTWPDGAIYRVMDAKKPPGLSEDGSTDNDLHVTLTTVQSPEYVNAAGLLATQFAAIGIKLTVSTVAPDELYGSVLSPHAYEILLTSELLGVDPDPYPFWHSSQTREGGLNLALYENRNVDTMLEEARKAIKPEDRATKYTEFQTQLAKDLPAIFLYQSTYAYAVSSKVKNVDLPRIASPSDRFADIASWYVKTKKVLH